MTRGFNQNPFWDDRALRSKEAERDEGRAVVDQALALEHNQDPTDSWLLPLRATASRMSPAPNDIRIRFATIDDAGLLLRLIRDLAAYERAPNAVIATEEDLRRYGFGPERQFEALLAFLDREPAGFALFHPRFSTWLGRPGVYLEDLFVTQAARGKGPGGSFSLRV